MDYEKDLEIDETALDLEWLDHSKIAMKYSKYWAECQMKLTQADENVKLIRAELIAKANEDPNKYLGEGVKPTVANIESYYRNHKKHKDAKQEWVEAQYECNIALSIKDEFHFGRKAALENLVKLHGQDYFAGPSIPRDIREERNKRQERVNKNISKKLKRKRNGL